MDAVGQSKHRKLAAVAMAKILSGSLSEDTATLLPVLPDIIGMLVDVLNEMEDDAVTRNEEYQLEVHIIAFPEIDLTSLRPSLAPCYLQVRFRHILRPTLMTMMTTVAVQVQHSHRVILHTHSRKNSVVDI